MQQICTLLHVVEVTSHTGCCPLPHAGPVTLIEGGEGGGGSGVWGEGSEGSSGLFT